MSQSILLYDTTLRDGAQSKGITFSLSDKIKIACKLDELGIHYIEGGYPGSNPKDQEFFQAIQKKKLPHAKIAAFGMTMRPESQANEDGGLQALLRAETKTVTIVGKTWDFHVEHALNTTLEENLRMIEESIAFLKKKKREVIFDAEHYFDGFRGFPKYTLRCLKAAERGGADWIVLCDTNGGTLPMDIAEVIRKTKNKVSVPLGIHAHNDSDTAVANSLTAVQQGVRQVQGTINGIGERCGNANLLSIIANLKLKMGINCIDHKALEKSKSISTYICEIANLNPREDQPFVGEKAFTHKGGMHVSAVMTHPETYEHISPEQVGNTRHVLVSELSGKSNILYKAEELGVQNLKEEQIRDILRVVKEKELQGFQYEGAEGSLTLLMRRILQSYEPFFQLRGFRLIVDKKKEDASLAEATIKVRVKEREEHTVGEGDGPVNALDCALRKVLEPFYPQIRDIHLTDFKVRVLDAKEGTAAKVRVLIESRNKASSWTTIGVSENIIEASWQALVDSLEYGLLLNRQSRAEKSPKRKKRARRKIS